MNPRVLLIEDDINLGEALEKYLAKESFQVERAKTLAEANEIKLDNIDIIILDWMLPDGQGIDWLQNQRAQGANTPVTVSYTHLTLPTTPYV